MSIKYSWLFFIATLTRFFPLPGTTGLQKIGSPSRDSPVLLTVNYRLTIQQVRRALVGMDAYLLVANSKGINVWCAAAGGHLSNHEVISVLKTSGIDNLVDHRKLILPQLAATGIEPRVISKKTGWKCLWGPVYAKDIPDFISNNYQKTKQMSLVNFNRSQRLEMAVALGTPLSIILSLVLLFSWKKALFPLNVILWTLCFILFYAFPKYEKRLKSRWNIKIGNSYLIKNIHFQLLQLGMVSIAIVSYNFISNEYSNSNILTLIIISGLIIYLLNIDLYGMTPTYKGSFHDETFEVMIDYEKCRGVADCKEVCPSNCFKVDHVNKITSRPRAYNCVECGACIVQCPFDALYFKSSEGPIILPEIIRTHKLNMMGNRKVK